MTDKVTPGHLLELKEISAKGLAKGSAEKRLNTVPTMVDSEEEEEEEEVLRFVFCRVCTFC